MSRDPTASYYDHGGIEVDAILRAKLTEEQYIGWLLGNIIAYACRAQWKGQCERDWQKLGVYAQWLSEHAAARLRAEKVSSYSPAPEEPE